MRKAVIAVLLALLAVATASVLIPDESSADICGDIRVYIQNPDGTYAMSTVGGVQTVRAAIDAALDDQDRTMETNVTRTNIVSIDGVKAGENQYWRLFQWLPAGSSGWGVQTFSAASNEKMVSGTTYCVTMSTMSSNDGVITYSEPDFEPESTGYVFIRFANGYSPDQGSVQSVFTPEIREEGFWIEGRGSNMGDVLQDAIDRNWPGELVLVYGDVGGNNLSAWIGSLFGLSDVNLGDNTWAYWSQWTWVDHEWAYNDWTLGYYDPAVYPYMECIYLISTPDPYGDDYILDKGGNDPNPETDGIVCMRNIFDVEFRLPDGSLWASQKVKYGQRVDMSLVPDPFLDGKEFRGWGDITVPVTDDLVFTADFIDLRTGMVRVTYMDVDGVTVLWREYVMSGSPAEWDGSPSKASTAQYDYVFRGWDSDLSGVSRDISVNPVFDSIVKSYTVYFSDYDRTPISESVTGYGSPAQQPPVPSRESTVSYQYDFIGWSLTPNNYVPVDLSNVTETLYVFAYYQPSAKEYTLTFIDSGNVVSEHPVKYGSVIGGRYALDLYKGEYLAKMYRDAGLTLEYDVNYVVVGDTTVHVSKIPGSYDSDRDADGNVVGDAVSVTYDSALASHLVATDGATLICDISQFSNGMAASFDHATLEVLSEILGGESKVRIVVPRGFLIMNVSDLVDISSGEGISFAVGNGPSSVKISSALKKLDYSVFYRTDLKSGNLAVMDISGSRGKATVGLEMGGEDIETVNVWNVTASGATSGIPSSYDGRNAVFDTDLLQFYAVGSPEAGRAVQTVTCPYGEVEFHSDGTGLNGFGTLVSMTVDNLGETLFVPSVLEGCTLRQIVGGAFNGVTNATSVVVPGTVQIFDWDSWTNPSVTDVYFIGDRPRFDGSVPSNVTVHWTDDAEGWDSEGDVTIHTYDGSHKKDVFSFTYYVLDGEIVIHRYVSGLHVDIPDSIAVGGTDYPVAHIGDSAFMFNRSSSVHADFDLDYRVYTLDTVEFGSSVRDIHSRAFHGSTLEYVLSLESVVHIGDEAFLGCGSLTNISMSDGLVFIGRSAFEGCDGKAFTRVTLPDTMVLMGDAAFRGCSNISNVSLGNGLSSISAECFEGCSNLTNLEISDGVAHIGDNAFRNCSGMQFVDLNNVVQVGANSFRSDSGDSSMEFVVIGAGITGLGDSAFSGNSSITEIEAHCPYFDSFEQAFDGLDLDSVIIYASNDVMDSWSGYDVEPLEERMEEDDDHLLLYVEVGLIVFFFIVGAVSLRYRVKSRE
ncbi:MAG: leucine-rich repeat protein [Candidatus Methanomethylophilaceae archaeon]|nr:leucine-rich repeat protein [Candidatus Methanomethylophilaceae archaeon]